MGATACPVATGVGQLSIETPYERACARRMGCCDVGLDPVQDHEKIRTREGRAACACRRMGCCDVGLDPVAINGVATTADALWCDP